MVTARENLMFIEYRVASRGNRPDNVHRSSSSSYAIAVGTIIMCIAFYWYRILPSDALFRFPLLRNVQAIKWAVSEFAVYFHVRKTEKAKASKLFVLCHSSIPTAIHGEMTTCSLFACRQFNCWSSRWQSKIAIWFSGSQLTSQYAFTSWQCTFLTFLISWFLIAIDWCVFDVSGTVEKFPNELSSGLAVPNGNPHSIDSKSSTKNNVLFNRLTDLPQNETHQSIIKWLTAFAWILSMIFCTPWCFDIAKLGMARHQFPHIHALSIPPLSLYLSACLLHANTRASRTRTCTQ